MRDLVMLLAFTGMLPFILMRPHIGVLLWGWVALLGPGSFMWGMAGSIRYNFIVAIITVIAWVLSRERVWIPASKTLALVLAFAVVTTISTFTAIGNEEAAFREWEKYLKIVAFFIAIIGLINSRSRIHGLLWALLFALGYHGVKEGLRFIASGGAHHIYGPHGLIIADNNHFALAMLMTLPIIWYLLRSASTRLARVGLLGGFATLFATVVGTFSRGGFLGMSAVVCWMIATGKGRIRLLLLLIPILLAALHFAPERWFERMETIETAQEDSSFSGRVTAWKLSTLIALDHPVFGGGFYAVQDFSTWTYYSSFVHRFDFIPSKPPDTKRAHAAHSIYFQVLGDHGFVGLFLYLSILLAAWLNTGRTMQLARRMPSIEWAGELAYALRLSLIAYMVSGAALSMAYFDLLYAIVGLSLTLLSIVEKAVLKGGTTADHHTKKSQGTAGAPYGARHDIDHTVRNLKLEYNTASRGQTFWENQEQENIYNKWAGQYNSLDLRIAVTEVLRKCLYPSPNIENSSLIRRTRIGYLGGHCTLIPESCPNSPIRCRQPKQLSDCYGGAA